jgi:DNA-binding winged helix-turn-helix (wHTH) protein/Tfp pilus assembly protein PilF
MRRYRVGPFEVRGARLVLACSSRQVAAGRKVVDTLAALVESPGDVATKEALLHRIWPDASNGETGLTQNVYVLRRLFREHGVDDAIETVPGVGYRLKCSAQPLAARRFESRALRALRFWPAAVAAIVAVACIYPLADLRSRDVEPSADTAQIDRLYAIGRYYWNLRTSSAVRTSMKYFGEIIQQDPQSELGYAGMADAYATMGDYCYGTHRPAIYFARAAAYARQALIIDPRSAPAHATLGFLLLHQKERYAATIELRRSLDADPWYAPAHEWYGLALALEGRFDAARTEMTRASQLAPLSVASTAWLAELAHRERRFAEARLYARDVRQLGGRFAARRLPRDHPTWAAVEEPAAAAIAP